MTEFTVNQIIIIFLLLLLLGIVLFLLKQLFYFKKLANTDQMTSLMNYTGLCKEINKFIKSKTPLSLSIIDIDDFGKYNKISYKFGDEVLKEFVLFLKQSLPEDLLLGRFRIGDEFVVVFKNADLLKAKLILNEFEVKLKHYKFSSLNTFPTHTVTFSEGVVEMNSENNNIEALFLEAENILKIKKLQLSHYK